LKRYLAYAGAVTALAGSAHGAYAADSTDDSLTRYGITLCGTVDIGYTYQNRGTRLNDYSPTGLQYLVQPSSNRPISSISENGMSQSKIGLRGTREFFEGWADLFKLETGINPLSADVADALKSITQNNEVPLAKRTSQGDSSRAGRAFQGAAYGGVSSPVYGTLTVGRQNGLLFDNALKYDPLGGPYAFSLIGYSEAAGGSGDTQDARLDDSVNYVNQVGMFRIGAQFQNKYIAAAKCPGGTKDSGGCSGGLDVYSLAAGHKFDRHFDVYTGFMWSRVADALAAGNLNSWTIDPTIGGRFNF